VNEKNITEITMNLENKVFEMAKEIRTVHLRKEWVDK